MKHLTYNRSIITRWLKTAEWAGRGRVTVVDQNMATSVVLMLHAISHHLEGFPWWRKSGPQKKQRGPAGHQLSNFSEQEAPNYFVRKDNSFARYLLSMNVNWVTCIVPLQNTVSLFFTCILNLLCVSSFLHLHSSYLLFLNSHIPSGGIELYLPIDPFQPTLRTNLHSFIAVDGSTLGGLGLSQLG